MTSSWQCPLCSFRTKGEDVLPTVIRHATQMHPAHLPNPKDETVASILDSIPCLIREAWLTLGAPNPGGESGRGAKSAGWVAPVELWTIDALRPYGDGGPESSALIARLVEASRIVWEALDPDARRTHPQPIGAPAWPTELRWLSSTWPDAQAYLDAADFAWVESEVRAIRGTLASLVRLKPHPRYLCPDCKAPMHLDEDGWMRCESGHTHPGPKRLEAEWRRKPPMPTKELCSALRVPEGTVYRWHHEKLLTPTRQEGRVMFWLPWDLIALRYPDIVTDINERDAA